MSEPAKSAIDRIVEQNNALWALLTDNTLTHEQKLACIERAFPSPPLCEADDPYWYL